jgi:hypothetical protein
MKNYLLITALLLLSFWVEAQTTLVRKSGVELWYRKDYYNTIEKYGCKFDQYKITAYVDNNSGQRIYWNWGGIDLNFSESKLTCYNQLYVGGKVMIDRGTTSASFSSFFYMNNGDRIQTSSFYVLVYEGANVPDPGWNWNWEAK